MTKPSKPTKAELHEMLAEAVRNTQPQPQPVDTQPEPVRNRQPAPKRKTRPAPKRTAKIKSARAPARRKRRPR
jgi:hypothetical protein